MGFRRQRGARGHIETSPRVPVGVSVRVEGREHALSEQRGWQDIITEEEAQLSLLQKNDNN